ncbi:hypothetical protein FRC08_003255 [Ceratobasidium sp. 394]|nr:hypothetical protein FRC08_003255 [Ceratobasidium sp. 394]
MSVTSVESDGSPQPSSCALPGEHSGSTQTRRAAQASAPLSDRTAVAKLLTQFFEQPSSVAHKPKYDRAKAELVCQWVNPIGMVCSNRKWANPGESLKKLTGRKTMGFCSGDRATVLRHLALHREEERLQTQGTNIPEDQRTIWDDFAIDGQLHLDSIRSSGEC